MRTKMYEIKKNKETKNFELKTVDFNFHSSLCQDGKIQFEKIYTREYARFEYFSLRCKYDNCNATPDDIEKMNLLENEFHFTLDDRFRDLSDLDPQLVGLMFLTLYAHDALFDDYCVKKDKDGNEVTNDNGLVYTVKKSRISLGLHDFYNKCKTTIAQFKNGAITLQEAVDIIKPLYNDCTTLINHGAVEKVCKKWVESTKEKNTTAFILGLAPQYKITRSNRIDEKSPLASEDQFSKYVAMWLVTGGTMTDKRKSDKSDRVTMDSLIKNTIRKNTK